VETSVEINRRIGDQQAVNLFDDLSGAGNSKLGVHRLSLAVNHYQGGHSPHSILPGRLLPHLAKHIKPDNRCFAG